MIPAFQRALDRSKQCPTLYSDFKRSTQQAAQAKFSGVFAAGFTDMIPLLLQLGKGHFAIF